jgi:hypothetical protein
MNGKSFRALALQLPEAEESEHQGHPDFRVGDKVFATLGPDEDWAMAKLTPPEQAVLIEQDSDAYEPCPGAWGARGYTRIELKAAKKALVVRALKSAWRNTAPKRLAKLHEFEGI